MKEAFVLGGWGMWPTLVFGLLTIASAVRYAIVPRRRVVPLMLSTGLMTMVTGTLGFATGVARSLLALSDVPPGGRWITLLGLGESMMDVILALALLVAAAIAATVGAWRFAYAIPEEATR
jgi:hypothetical protein